MYPHNNKGYDFTMQQFIQYYGLLERLFRLKFHRGIDVSYIQCYFVFSINLGKVLDIMQVQTLSLYSGIDRDEVKKGGLHIILNIFSLQENNFCFNSKIMERRRRSHSVYSLPTRVQCIGSTLPSPLPFTDTIRK